MHCANGCNERRVGEMPALLKAELELAIQRRETRLPLGSAEIDAKIVERFYQARAIRRRLSSIHWRR